MPEICLGEVNRGHMACSELLAVFGLLRTKPNERNEPDEG